MATTDFRRAGEVELDARRRLSLGKAGKREHTRYLVEENDEGEIRLIPVVSVPARELFVWNNPELLASLRRGLEDAAAGRVVYRGSFSRYADDEDDAEG